MMVRLALKRPFPHASTKMEDRVSWQCSQSASEELNMLIKRAPAALNLNIPADHQTPKTPVRPPRSDATKWAASMPVPFVLPPQKQSLSRTVSTAGSTRLFQSYPEEQGGTLPAKNLSRSRRLAGGSAREVKDVVRDTNRSDVRKSGVSKPCAISSCPPAVGRFAAQPKGRYRGSPLASEVLGSDSMLSTSRTEEAAPTRKPALTANISHCTRSLPYIPTSHDSRSVQSTSSLGSIPPSITSAVASSSLHFTGQTHRTENGKSTESSPAANSDVDMDVDGDGGSSDSGMDLDSPKMPPRPAHIIERDSPSSPSKSISLPRHVQQPLINNNPSSSSTSRPLQQNSPALRRGPPSLGMRPKTFNPYGVKSSSSNMTIPAFRVPAKSNASQSSSSTASSSSANRSTSAYTSPSTQQSQQQQQQPSHQRSASSSSCSTSPPVSQPRPSQHRQAKFRPPLISSASQPDLASQVDELRSITSAGGNHNTSAPNSPRLPPTKASSADCAQAYIAAANKRSSYRNGGPSSVSSGQTVVTSSNRIAKTKALSSSSISSSTTRTAQSPLPPNAPPSRAHTSGNSVPPRRSESMSSRPSSATTKQSCSSSNTTSTTTSTMSKPGSRNSAPAPAPAPPPPPPSINPDSDLCDDLDEFNTSLNIDPDELTRIMGEVGGLG